MMRCIDARTGRIDGEIPNEYKAQVVEDGERRCDFCGKPESLCKKLVAGAKGHICGACIPKATMLCNTYMDAA